jgi:hypothetical protein
LDRLLHGYDLVLIVGYAMTGKTKLSEFFDDRKVVHTDDYIGRESEILKDVEDKCCVEGIYGFRMLRDGFEPDVVVRVSPKFEAMPKHRAQRKACDTIWGQWLSRGPEIPIVVIGEDELIFALKLERMILNG